jgi:competence protein ComEA
MRRLLQGRPRVATVRPSFALSVAAATLLLSTLAVATPSRQGTQQTIQKEPPTVAEDPDTGLFHRLCDECHTSAQIVSRRRTRAEWEDVITKMIEKGLGAPEKDLETVFAFLNRNYGRVFINRAPADELVAVLQVSQQDADALVAYRKTAGAFADFEAIRKVPGIDVKKLENKKDAIAY